MPHNPLTTLAQIRQRELAWLLYVTEGYLGNLLHALAVNGITFSDADMESADRAVRATEAFSERLRIQLRSAR